MWSAIGGDRGAPVRTTAGELRELGIVGGQQGVWVDQERTATLSADAVGVTVSVMHNGTSYADDLSSDGVLYHYPRTGRSGARDANEIAATKHALEFGVPIFIVTRPSPRARERDVFLGWVEEFSDDGGVFLISFGKLDVQPAPAPAPADDAPFFLTATREERKAMRTVKRRGQTRFRFEVAARCGWEGAACGFDVSELLEAAHLCPVEQDGSDDPRNGLIFCPLHHRAFDAGLWGIDPTSTAFVSRPAGPDLAALRITHTSLGAVRALPHRGALEWAWDHWRARPSTD